MTARTAFFAAEKSNTRTDDVYQCFQRIIANRPKPKTEPMIGGRCSFLYLDKNGKPMVALHWEHYFKHICQKYNSIYRK